MNRKPMPVRRGGFTPRGGPAGVVKRPAAAASKLYQIDFESSSYSGTDSSDIPHIKTKATNKVQYSSSSTSEESEGDDVPVIVTAKSQPNQRGQGKGNLQQQGKQPQKKAQPVDLMSDYSYSDDDDQVNGEQEVITEKQPPEYFPPGQKKQRQHGQQQWAPKNQKAGIERQQPQQPQHTIIKPKKQLIQQDGDESEGNNNYNNNNNNNNNISNNINKESEPPKAKIESYQQPQNTTQPPIYINSNVNNNNQGIEQNQGQNQMNACQVNPAPTAGPTPTDQLICYNIGWKKGMKKKTHLHMTFNDQVVYFSKETKTAVGKCHIICTNKNVDRYSKSYVGSLKKSQMLSRFTLFVPAGELHGTRESEVFGISFYDYTELKGFHGRTFRFALPKTQPYFPTTKQMNLSRIAKDNIKSDDINIYHSKLPEILPGNRHRLQFGNVYVVSSVKNFIMEDENNNVIYMIYKSSDGICSVRLAPPITPLIAFGLSIAIITSSK